MKNLPLTALLILWMHSYLPAQTNHADLNWININNEEQKEVTTDYFFDIERKDKRPFVMSRLKQANRIGDFVDGFPSDWLTDNINVEITTKYQGQIRRAVSIGEVLSPDQKVMLSSCNLYTAIHVNVKYQIKNAVTHQMDNRSMEIDGTAFPENEAVFIGGEVKLKSYLRMQIEKEISDKGYLNVVRALIGFTINEQGSPVDVKVLKTSGSSETDKSLIKIIRNMPIWNPATVKAGNSVKQDFVFNIGNGGC